MNKETTQKTSIASVRLVAAQFETQDIERCMQQALENKSNPCHSSGSVEEIMNVLAKASYIKAKVDAGMSVANALRELGQRMRVVQEMDNE